MKRTHKEVMCAHLLNLDYLQHEAILTLRNICCNAFVWCQSLLGCQQNKPFWLGGWMFLVTKAAGINCSCVVWRNYLLIMARIAVAVVLIFAGKLIVENSLCFPWLCSVCGLGKKGSTLNEPSLDWCCAESTSSNIHYPICHYLPQVQLKIQRVFDDSAVMQSQKQNCSWIQYNDKKQDPRTGLKLVEKF